MAKRLEYEGKNADYYRNKAAQLREQATKHNDGGSDGNPDNFGNYHSRETYEKIGNGELHVGLPILLDLDDNGVKIDDLSRSTTFVDAGGDGLKHRSAWAGAGDGVLFFDADGDGTLSQKREYVFTEWDPTASSDMEALRSYFDTNGDGKLTSADAAFAQFKVLVTNADGTKTVRTLAELGITEINLTEDATRIVSADGSVIEGQTTFKKADGSTGTVASTKLVAEADGHRVTETVSTGASGNRVSVQTCYDVAGKVLYSIRSVATPSGSNITNFYDDNGDGVTDRIQTIDTVTNANGSKTETIVNKVGAVTATAITVSRTETTRSADGKSVVIERDSTGGGWFDQREVQVINADGSRTNTISDLGQSGAVIRSVAETISADGKTRSTAVNEDGLGGADTTTAHAITVNGDNSRTEVVSVTNGDGSLRTRETVAVSVDGRVKTTTSDLDGDGDTDLTEAQVIVVSGAGSTSTITLKNGDNSVRSVVTQTQSADTLTKTIARDVDGDGDSDTVTVDQTVVNADQSRVETITTTNVDGSVREKTKVTLGADKVTSETWVDLNQDGTFQTTDLVKSVAVDGATQVRTATVWARNADGSVQSSEVMTTSADGLDITTVRDADGDGDTDTVVTDVTTIAAGIATQTVTVKNQDNSVRSKTETVTSADGLTTTTQTDIDGNGTYDAKTIDVRVLNGDGSTTRTVSDFAGNGTTLTGRTVTVQSADRRTVTVTKDTNGDGATDSVTSSVAATDGSKTVTAATYNANGTLASKTVSAVTANGLSSTTTSDRNGDGLNETITADTTALNANGSRTRTVDVNNGDGSNRSVSVTTISDDALTKTVQSDNDGDGVFERTATSANVLNANGSTTTTDILQSQNGAVLSRSVMTVSDDRLASSTQMDGDGDGDFDLTSSTTTVLLNNGGTSVTSELRDASAGLRSRSVVVSSDDLRSVTTSRDVNGDGHNDIVATRVVADDGTVTDETANYTAGGALQSREQQIVSDDGLLVQTRMDADGNGAFERNITATTVLNADGSATKTTVAKAADGSTFSSSAVTTSDDGLTTTQSVDLNADGTVDFTSVSATTIAASGIRTDQVTERSSNNSVTKSTTKITSADGRSINENIDLDGNGVADLSRITTVEANGETRVSTSFRSSAGAQVAVAYSSVSGDGLTRIDATDRNGDGRWEILSTDRTVLGQDGTSERSVTHRNDRYVSLGSETYVASDDGLQTSSTLDLDGNGVFDFRTAKTTTFEADGDLVTRETTVDATWNTLSDITTTTSGNGLRTSVVADYSGDGSIDRVTQVTKLADGASAIDMRNYGAGMVLQQSTSTAVSADGRFTKVDIDLDGNGHVDRTITTQIDTSRNSVTTVYDRKTDGSGISLITSRQQFNGASGSVEIDLNGDGLAEITRSTTVEYLSNGSKVTTVSELNGARLSYRETTTAAANDLSSSTVYDTDGDGVTDGTATRQVTINLDGSQRDLQQTSYADGTLRSKTDTFASADGRFTRVAYDYDGNGFADKVSEVTVAADGSSFRTDTTFDEGGARIQQSSTSTSADGLVTWIVRAGNVQSITRSAVDNGSYVWQNGVTAAVGQINSVVRHDVDALGIETWTAVQRWKVASSTDASSTYTVRLDATAKARVLAEAARIYDTVLDRDMDFNEVELLVTKIVDGQLDRTALVSALMTSTEYQTRYGTMSDAQFVTQLFLNSFGRAPTLDELHIAVFALASDTAYRTVTGTVTRTDLARYLAEAAEHTVVGNSHLRTNNFDLAMNPAEFERTIDRGYAISLIKNLIDVVYDREATSWELAILSYRLLSGTDKLSDVASSLLALSGRIQGVSTASLAGLTGAALVEQAFLNALGRQPTAQEQQGWEYNLSSGHITAADFVVALSQSVEHLTAGSSHLANPLAAVNVWNGSAGADSYTGWSGDDSLSGHAGNDSLSGGDGSDKLQGGVGHDLLQGGKGNDTYVWSHGDGSDTIVDFGTSGTETDRLVLTNVTSSQVYLGRNGNHLQIAINGPSGLAIITDTNRFEGSTLYGIEEIQFSDGVIWRLSEILAKTVASGTAGSDVIDGTAYADVVDGGAGDDRLTGAQGADTLTGGIGADTLEGGAGGDAYIWSRWHGADTINDTTALTTDVDKLVLTDVASSDVQLFRATGSNDLIVRVAGTGGADILVKNRFVGGASTSGDVAPAGNGIEVIQFSDGVQWTLSDILAKTTFGWNQGATSVAGTSLDDFINAGAGNDTVTGGMGNDTIIGVGGDDSLSGGGGNDLYRWWRGNGTDTISDGATSTSEIDVLKLENVTSSEVYLYRVQGSYDLRLRVFTSSPAEEIVISSQFLDPKLWYGIESILFSDGVSWSIQDIWSRTWSHGTDSSDTLTGTNYMDNFKGQAGADTISGYDGDDLFVGGTGADRLEGGNGNDRYEWSMGEGNDLIIDTGAGATTDTLALLNVASTGVILWRYETHLMVSVTATGEHLNVWDRFSGANTGVEIITFSDGVTTEVLDSAAAEIVTTGTAAGQVLNGWAYKDTIHGLGGNDTLNGAAGDDRLIGGTGTDYLDGGSGNDTYVWSRGDGNDAIGDTAVSRTEIDTLILTDVASTAVSIGRLQGQYHLYVTVVSPGGNETITILDRFLDPTKGKGIERIEFSDGVAWNLDDILRVASFWGTSGNDSMSGVNLQDNAFGLEGNDTIATFGGDDLLDGGTGADILDGGTGNDTYVWRRGDAGDAVNDSGTSIGESDILNLKDVNSTDVSLVRTNGSWDLKVVVASAGGSETITVVNQFYSLTLGYGIEAISFADGVIWSFNDNGIRTSLQGTVGNDTLSGVNFSETMLGLAGNDSILGYAGDDHITGGLGADTMDGGAGYDTYVWSKGDGFDVINDSSAQVWEADTLQFSDATSGEVLFQRANGSWNLLACVMTASGWQWLTIVDQTKDLTSGVGIEKAVFADGVTWTLQEIMAHTTVHGTAAAETLYSTNYGEILLGNGGNDSIVGNGGNDTLNGGVGADTLNGGEHTDTASYSAAVQGVKVELWKTGAQTGFAGGEENGDVLIAVENLEGSAFGDYLIGNDESNDLIGLAGNDTIGGLDGYDRLYGGDGNDWLDGGSGADLLTGGTGADIFRFSAINFGNDIVADFTDGQDKLSFALAVADDFSDFTISGNGTDTVTVSIGSNSVVLHGVTPITVAADDFVFS